MGAVQVNAVAVVVCTSESEGSFGHVHIVLIVSVLSSDTSEDVVTLNVARPA